MVISVSISLFIMGVFNLLLSSWFNFGILYESRNASVSFRFSNRKVLIEHRSLKYSVTIF